MTYDVVVKGNKEKKEAGQLYSNVSELDALFIEWEAKMSGKKSKKVKRD